jgi:ferrous iron transport protein A
MDIETRRLGTLTKGQGGVILRLLTSEEQASLTARLLEMGFVEGSLVEVIHEAPFGKDPIAVRIRGTLIALRRQEANVIEVKLSA